jgi:hypothetical protein
MWARLLTVTIPLLTLAAVVLLVSQFATVSLAFTDAGPGGLSIDRPGVVVVLVASAGATVGVVELLRRPGRRTKVLGLVCAVILLAVAAYALWCRSTFT